MGWGAAQGAQLTSSTRMSESVKRPSLVGKMSRMTISSRSAETSTMPAAKATIATATPARSIVKKTEDARDGRSELHKGTDHVGSGRVGGRAGERAVHLAAPQLMARN